MPSVEPVSAQLRGLLKYFEANPHHAAELRAWFMVSQFCPCAERIERVSRSNRMLREHRAKLGAGRPEGMP